MNRSILKKRIIRIALLAATIVSLFYVPWILVGDWILPLPNNVEQQLEQATNHGFDGIIVCIDWGNKPTELYAAGWHDREKKIPAYPQALFKIASVGKLYNAVAVSKLARDGVLSLDKTLADYLPELQSRIDNSANITLRMMVQHRSGIPNYTDTHNYWVAPKTTDAEKLELVLDLPANFEPDKDYEYSNTNYLLLAKIMDKVLNYDHFQYIKEEILMPLNLQHTFGSIKDVDMDEVMSGYYVGYESDLKTDNIGSMLATAEDLAKFIRALNDGSIFRDEKEQQIYSSIYKYGHTGLIPGYQTIAKYHKDIDAVVIQFTNTVDFEGYNWNLSEIMYSRVVKILKYERD